jgi:hypothetical protein
MSTRFFHYVAHVSIKKNKYTSSLAIRNMNLNLKPAINNKIYLQLKRLNRIKVKAQIKGNNYLGTT